MTAGPGTGRRALVASLVPVSYPTMIAAAYVLLLYFNSGASLWSAMRAFVVVAVGGVAITIAMSVLLLDRHRGGLAAAIVVLLLITGGDRSAVVLLGLALMLIAIDRLYAHIGRARFPWFRFTRVGNAIGVLAVLVVALPGLVSVGLEETHPDPGIATSLAVVTPADRPDVVVIVLDGYGRADYLQKLGFDNSSFIGDLEERGFDVATDSRSNYIVTSWSLASLLNMTHLSTWADAARTLEGDRLVRFVRTLVSDNAVLRAFKSRGYETVALASGFEEVAVRHADRYVDTGQLNEFEFLLFRYTGLSALAERWTPDLFADQQRDRVHAVLESVGDVVTAAAERPRFVFAHVPSPHAPFVLGRQERRETDLDTFFEDGAKARGMSQAEYARAYTSQVETLNGLVLATVDRILDGAPGDSLVILLSDHGSAAGLDWDALERSDLGERTANLVAVRAPNGELDLPDDITLVNVFPSVLREYLDIDVEPLDDVSYRWAGSYFDLVPIDTGSTK